MEQDTLNEIWYPIPGFPSYEVSTNFKVRNIVKGRELTISPKGDVTIRNTEGYGGTVHRILYAAMHQKDPRDLGRVFVVVDSDNKIKLIQRSDFLRSIGSSRPHIVNSTEDAIAYYKTITSTINTILKFYETGDLTDVFHMVYQEKNMIIDYAIKRGFVESSEMSAELFSAIAERLIIGIQKKEYLCVDIPRYLKFMARNYIAEWRKERKKMQGYSAIASKRHLALIDRSF